MSCIFCSIISGEIPAELLHQDDLAVAFRDINPQAPVHIIIVPRRHIPSLAEMSAEDAAIAGHMVGVASDLARREGIAEKGYRLVFNSGPDGTQVVPHLHMHLLGGRRLTDDMG